MLLKGHTALITGASRGIGAEIARRFSRQGCTVIINYIDDKDPVDDVLEDVKKSSSNSVKIRFDISKQEDVENSVNKLVEELGGIDILVNNAGILKSSKLTELKHKDLKEVLSINLEGSFNCLQAVSRYMIRKKYGKIINISSISQFTPFFNTVHYAMSKSGIKMLTRCAALELGEFNINVNTIVPGIIKTGITDDYKDENLMKKMEELIALKRIGSPEDVASAALFLASSLSDYITGTEILVDGGFTLFKNKVPY